MQFINDKNGTPPHGPYSHAVRTGNLLFVSGQVPYNNDGELIGTNITTQTEQTMKNLQSLLASAGLSLKSVVKTTVYLANWGDFAEFNKAYAAFMGDHKPARATVEVSGIAGGALIELDAVAEFSA